MAVAGCGASPATPAAPGSADPLRAQLPPAPTNPVAVPIGSGPRFRPAAQTDPAGAPVGRLHCLPDAGPRHGAHVELFAAGRVVVVPAGIGVARGCTYPVRTRDRTGVVEVRGRVTLGDLFAVWGAPLSRARIAGFRGPVRVYVAGRRVTGDPRAVVLTRHAQVVLAVGPRVPVHASYRFVPGL